LQGNAPSKIFEAQNEIYFNKIFSLVSVTVNGSLLTGLLVLLELPKLNFRFWIFDFLLKNK